MLILESFGSCQCVRVFGVFLSLDWTGQRFWSTTLFKHFQLRRSHENDEVWRSQARHCYMQQYPQESSLLQKKATCMMSLRLFFFPSIKFTDLTKFHTRFFKKRWTSMNSFAKTVGPVGSGPRVDHESVYGHYAGQNVAELLEESGCVRVSCFDQNRRKVSICEESDVQSVNFLILVLHPLILPVSICCILISWSVAQGVASAVAESHAQGAGAAAQKLLPDLLCLLGRNIIPTKEKYGLNLIFWRTNWYGPNTFHLLIAETSCVYSALLHWPWSLTTRASAKWSGTAWTERAKEKRAAEERLASVFAWRCHVVGCFTNVLLSNDLILFVVKHTLNYTMCGLL